MQDDQQQFYFAPNKGEIVNVLLTGIIASAAAAGLTWVTSNYLIAQVICRQSTEGLCGDPFTLSYNIFLIISALAATGWFAYSRIFRPALVTLSVIIVLWSLPVVFAAILAQDLLLFGLINVLFITFSYVAFYWVVRVRNFLVVFLLWLALTLGLRFLLVY